MSSDEGSGSEGFDPRELEVLERLEAEEENKSSSGKRSKKRGRKPLPKKNYNNMVGLQAKLEEIQHPQNWHWVETLDVTTPTPLELENVNDDLKREAAFYQQTLHAVKHSLGVLRQCDIPWERPADYFAEMVKSDEHMQKVKARLLSEHKRMAVAAERQKQKEAAKYQKLVHSNRVQEKQKRKTAEIEKFKKMRIKKGGTSGGGVKVRGAGSKIDLSDKAGRGKQRPQAEKSAKRKAADAKYGRPKRSKKNDAESLNDPSAWRRQGKGGDGERGGKGGGKKKKFVKKRPGKNARGRGKK